MHQKAGSAPGGCKGRNEKVSNIYMLGVW